MTKLCKKAMLYSASISLREIELLRKNRCKLKESNTKIDKSNNIISNYSICSKFHYFIY